MLKVMTEEKNLNEFAKHIEEDGKAPTNRIHFRFFRWVEKDPFFANQLSANLYLSVKKFTRMADIPMV